MEISSHVLHVILVVTEYLMCVSFLREPTPSDTSTGNHLLTNLSFGCYTPLAFNYETKFFYFLMICNFRRQIEYHACSR